LVGSRNQSKTPLWLLIRFYQKQLEIYHQEKTQKVQLRADSGAAQGSLIESGALLTERPQEKTSV
jgi:hypothetical protein